MSKIDAVDLLQRANINPDDRAETLSIDDWLRLTAVL